RVEIRCSRFRIRCTSEATSGTNSLSNEVIAAVFSTAAIMLCSSSAERIPLGADGIEIAQELGEVRIAGAIFERDKLIFQSADRAFNLFARDRTITNQRNAVGI